ncbi:MAG: dihydroorotate dehydrogenase electron transfer subunit [Propionibacteriaceae bacterium]|jgi:dihydroorotate dehydrogenase electron transfer subunit|nr:dihydroorotate dehydrogenase electron transfer subunit [Propionibacteriaceae bacterium]
MMSLSGPRLETATILEHELIARQTWRLRMAAPAIAAAVEPGQFVHLRLPGRPDHILRRPFSVYDVGPGWLECLYQVVGAGTAALSTTASGGSVDLLGPIGHGWQPPHDTRRALLVGGGLGIAPLYLLAQRLAGPDVSVTTGTLSTTDTPSTSDASSATLTSALAPPPLSPAWFSGVTVEAVLGVQTVAALFGEADFTAVVGAANLTVTTDDGSYGRHGLTTDVVQERLVELGIDYIACCGPEPMQRRVAELAAAAGVACQVSLERRMACGLGACLTCVVETHAGWRRSCVDGPVFAAPEVIW